MTRSTQAGERPSLTAALLRATVLTAAALTLLVASIVALALQAGTARAAVLPATTIDGPSENIVGFGGVAMAEDGTGGLVYLKRVDGVAHVFVSRYVEGRWQAPIRVDTGQPFAASWPRIGAANGGELVVVWATPFATEGELPVDELVGATLSSGSSSFGPAILIDPNIGDGTGTSPDIAMSATGQADVVYRVVNRALQNVIPLLRPGDVIESVRAAHYNGQRWARLGTINRNAGVSMRPPTSANAPQLAIGPTGNGVIVWQEPDEEGVARIWARRLFGSTLDYVLPVSATSFSGAPVGNDADGASVAISKLGQAEVAYRQSVGPGSPLPGPRIFLNTLPDGESADGSRFTGAAIVDSAVSGGAAAQVGPPSIDIDDRQDVRLVYDANGTPRVIEGNDRGLSAALSLSPAFVGGELAAASVMNPTGGGVSAWPSADAHGDPAVSVLEDFPGGAAQTALVSGGAGGEVAELAVGRSGLGDGIVGFRQGPLGNAAIVATQATAPPVKFILTAPRGWVTPAAASVSWLPALSANGPLRYRVVLDGRVQATPAGVFSLRIDARGLGSGTHRAQVLATDLDGQATLSSTATLRVDGTPPTVQITKSFGGSGVSINIRDPNSGVQKSALSVSFGDGRQVAKRARVSHRYGRAGIYTVVVHVGDKVGNRATVRRLVSVR